MDARSLDLPAPEFGELIEDYNAPPLLRSVHVAEDGAYIHKRGGRLLISRDGEDLLEIPLERLDQVSASGEGAISYAALRELAARDVSFVLHSAPGEALISTNNLLAGNIDLQRRQFIRHQDPGFNLSVAREIVSAKIANARTVLRRYYRVRGGWNPESDESLQRARRQAREADDLNTLRGHEGQAARLHFEAISTLLPEGWGFRQRVRNPPRDPVNALLSYGYAILHQNVLTLLARRGLNPYVGALHAPRPGHAALASDIMEEFRAIVVDATVLRLLLGGRITPAHFSRQEGLPRLTREGKRIFIEALESRFDAPMRTTDGQPTDLRRIIQQQIQQWADLLLGRLQTYNPYLAR